MSAKYTSIGVLPYTLLPSAPVEDGVAETSKDGKARSIAFMLWLDRRSTSIESSQYYSHVICPVARGDRSPIDTALRAFHTKTHGKFVPQTNKPSATEAQLQHRLRANLIHPQAAAAFTNAGHLIYVCPVRYIPAIDLNKACLDHGSVVWVPAKDLLAQIYSSAPAASLCINTKPLTSISTVATESMTLPLYLPFTALMRSEQSVSALARLMTNFEVENSFSNLFDNEIEYLDDSSRNSFNTMELTEETEESNGLSSFCCSRCRQKLFSNQDLVDHISGVNQRPFSSKGVQASSSLCTSYFINPSHHLADLSLSEGKLSCPKCMTRVGTFSWSGAQCSCGEWITPSFQIPKSRVDDKAYRPTLTRIHRPANLLQ